MASWGGGTLWGPKIAAILSPASENRNIAIAVASQHLVHSGWGGRHFSIEPKFEAKFSLQVLEGQRKVNIRRITFILSDPRNRNHKSLAIANHNFEVASFSRRNRNEIAVLQVVSESQ